MAVEGKKPYKLYLDEKNVETIKKFLDSRPNSGGLSSLIDMYVARVAVDVEENQDILSKIEPGPLTLKKIWHLFQIQKRKAEERSKISDSWKDQSDE
jgi:hypothetical protein